MVNWSGRLYFVEQTAFVCIYYLVHIYIHSPEIGSYRKLGSGARQNNRGCRGNEYVSKELVRKYRFNRIYIYRIFCNYDQITDGYLQQDFNRQIITIQYITQPNISQENKYYMIKHITCSNISRLKYITCLNISLAKIYHMFKYITCSTI